METKRLGWAVARAMAVMSALWGIHAQAELGGGPMSPPVADTAATVHSLQRTIQAASGSTTGAPASYTVHEITLGSGTVIREYVSTGGSVFGVAWQGPTIPDLKSLFGSHFPQYTAGVESAHAARGWRAPVSVDTDSLVIHTGGHMGAFSGQAWLPQALPAGMTGTDIQ